MIAPTRERARRYSQLEARTGNLITPDVGLTRPNSILNVVDFPAPFGTKKTIDVTSLNTYRQTVNRSMAAKTFRQVFRL